MAADSDALQRNIDYVCGLGLDCGPIQEGGPCFLPNSVRAHAAYTMNMYYQVMGGNGYDCDFEQTGTISHVDPSKLHLNYYQNCALQPMHIVLVVASNFRIKFNDKKKSVLSKSYFGI